jgi:hypothetical protein
MELNKIDINIIGIDHSKIASIPNTPLFKIYVELNQAPPSKWGEMFEAHWHRPRQWTSMHRHSIASVTGKYILLNGTTIEEIDKYHKATLKICVEDANKSYNAFIENELREKQQIEFNKKKQDEAIELEKEKAKKIKF